LRRRRSNNPGNSQAKGPIIHNTLERDFISPKEQNSQANIQMGFKECYEKKIYKN
tara:strand:+ start:163 stop:327 length:165 start_codon:yes stop_codon:yes gene_type:complete